MMKKIIIIGLVAITVISTISLAAILLSVHDEPSKGQPLHYKAILRPIANHNMEGCNEGSNYNWWIPLPQQENWKDVDDSIADGNQSYVAIGNLGFDMYQFDWGTANATQINSITLHVIVSTDTPGVNDFYIGIWRNLEGTDSPNRMVMAQFPNHWEEWNCTWYNNPWTESKWTVDNIQGLEATITAGNNTSNIYCTQVYMEIDYGAYTYMQGIKVPGN